MHVAVDQCQSGRAFGRFIDLVPKILEHSGRRTANFFMVGLRRDVQPVIQAFREEGVLVGRPFPPMTEHLRVSVGVPEDMERFLVAFKKIMSQPTTTDDGWWLAIVWVTDEDGVVSFVELAPAAGPRPEPPLVRLPVNPVQPIASASQRTTVRSTVTAAGAERHAVTFWFSTEA